MTTPVGIDDIIAGASAHLRAQPDVLAVLGRYPGTDTPFLFQHRLWVKVENSQSTACVLTRNTGWTGPNVHNTLRFPRVGVDVWADPIRDDANNVLDPDEAVRRVTRAYQVIDRHLHRPQSGVQWWGDVRTIACARLAEPMIFPDPDGQKPLRLQVFYAVTEG